MRYIYENGATSDARDREEREEEQTIKHQRHLAPLRLVGVFDLRASVVLVKFFINLADVGQQLPENPIDVRPIDDVYLKKSDKFMDNINNFFIVVILITDLHSGPQRLLKRDY